MNISGNSSLLIWKKKKNCERKDFDWDKWLANFPRLYKNLCVRASLYFFMIKKFKYWIDIKNTDAQSFNFFTNDIYKSIQTC